MPEQPFATLSLYRQCHCVAMCRMLTLRTAGLSRIGEPEVSVVFHVVACHVSAHEPRSLCSPT
jgi:hypothetical protein